MSDIKEVFNIAPGISSVEIVHTEGLKKEHPHTFNVSGRIDSPSNYVEGRDYDKEDLDKKYTQGIDDATAMVTVDYKNGVINLFLDPSDKYAHTITGTLLPAPELSIFKINTDAPYTRDALLKLIRFNAFRIDKAEALIDALRKLDLATFTKSHNERDKKGNIIQDFTKNVTSSIPESFKLTIPIFQGMPEKSFYVEIIIDVTDNNIKFWLESVELSQLIETFKKEIMDEEIEKLSDLLIIYKN